MATPERNKSIEVGVGLRSLKIAGEERGWGVNNYNSNRIDIKYGVSQNDSMTGLDNKRRRWRWNAILNKSIEVCVLWPTTI